MLSMISRAGRLLLTAVCCCGVGSRFAQAQTLQLQPGDRISIIGNTLADRMQHDGWLETLIQSRFPRHELVFRNLGFPGDELTLRLRSAGFGSPDEWLSRTQADVVFAFFGYNESHAGPEGLEAFKADLARLIEHTRGQKYNGKSSPRLVLFSPIAHENLGDPNLPDGRENNERIDLYTRAMAEVAQARDVPFVDLYRATLDLYPKAPTPLTINGVHLNETGNRLVAEVIDRTLFKSLEKRAGDARDGQLHPAVRDILSESGFVPRSKRERDAALQELRQAVLDKNFYWFNRYRTVDGYSIYGGRADLKFVDGQTNREVMQREMEVLDVMTANRDRRIWAVAQGGDLEVDDSNTPPFVPVVTNKPGEGPNGEHLFLDGEEAISQMTVAEGMEVNLVASEKEFPELINPVQMSFDTQGRLWVATWPTYPHWKPKEEMDDRLLILEDTDGDGKADVCKTFAGGLHNPTGFEFWGGGVFVAQAPDVLFLKDTDGDDKADVRIRVLSGIDSADTHHTANSFTLDPGGALYFQEGTFHHTQVETPYGPPVRCANAGVFRYEPRTQKFEVYVTFGFANPHGHAFDRWGQDIVVDGTGANPFHAALFSGHMEFPQKHARPPQVYQQRTRPCPAIETLSSRHFPEEMQGNLLVQNVIGFQGILQYRIDDKGASFAGTEGEPMLSSTDPNFRPVDLEIGPDGALYFVDWQNPIIGHMQHNLRDPSRDRKHGRVYRVTYPRRPLLEPKKIAGEPIEKLLELLQEPEDRVRYRARIELSARETNEVIDAVSRWIGRLDEQSPQHEHNLLEALWMHQQHNVVNTALLERVLSSPDFRARAAAARVLCYWRDRVTDSLEIFRKLAADEHPRVRLEAVRAASFYPAPEAIEVALISAEQPSDEYLDFTRGETMKTLEPYWKDALAKKQDIHFTTDIGRRFLLKNMSVDDLLRAERSRAVYMELLFRPGVRDEYRQEALAGLAKLDNRAPMQVLLAAIREQDEREDSQDASVVYDLIRLLTSRRAEELARVRPELEALAIQANLPITRQLGFVGLIAADNGVEPAWKLASQSVEGLLDLLGAMPLIPDASLRAALYSKVEPLLDSLPAELASSKKGGGTYGQFVRIELPRRGTLTLAEVEVYSGGINVARQGRASQQSTAHGGVAERGIDGKTSARYGDGGQTHTDENARRPWWQVDLGREYPIEAIVIYNRTEGQLGQRLDGFTLKVLDGGRKEVVVREKLPAPKPKARIELEGEGPKSLVRRAAMIALTSVRGQEGPTFRRLARFIRNNVDRHAAIQAVQRIPTAEWPRDEAGPLVESLLAWLRDVPVQDRTSPAALDAMQLAHALASLLPSSQAVQVRQQLDELGVRVVRIGTVPHQMLFDRERLVMQAGKPVEILFENTDNMPHNFVLTQPGALEEIGLLAEATATQPGALERQYVPPSDKVLLASDLLQPGQSQKLSYTPPARPGVYPYVCTYPGHWRRMYGALYVVEDLDAYLADPEAYLAAHSLPIADDLLKNVRPRTEWTLKDLVGSLEELQHGRSFGNGKQLLQVASCTACHRLNGVGSEIGPDLSKLDPMWTPTEILKEILNPSERINEKYQTFTFVTESGKPVTGLVVEETAESVKVIENPLAKTEPLVLKKAEIVERVKSNVSIMPKGLLDKLTREEILDLIAYVASRGDAKHPLVNGGHAHHH